MLGRSRDRPAGSGKTTLVSSYLEDRGLPSLWYRVDEDDTDVASFFYYLGLACRKAAPRHRRPLPLLTPEETKGIVRVHRKRTVSRGELKALHDQVRGWVAGLVPQQA